MRQQKKSLYYHIQREKKHLQLNVQKVHHNASAQQSGDSERI